MFGKRWVVVIGCLVLATFLFQFCMQAKHAMPKDPRGIGYAGSSSCGNCHAAIVDAYKQTAHNRTTSSATAENIAGSFQAGENQFHYTTDVKVLMEAREGNFSRQLLRLTNKKPHFPLIL